MSLDGAGSVLVGTTWYWVVQGQNRAFRPVYIEKVEIWLGVTDPSQTDTQTAKYSATQLV